MACTAARSTIDDRAGKHKGPCPLGGSQAASSTDALLPVRSSRTYFVDDCPGQSTLHASINCNGCVPFFKDCSVGVFVDGAVHGYQHCEENNSFA